MKDSPAWYQYPKFEFDENHATVIGGGIAGAQVCYHLCNQGWKVTLIERHKQLSSEASGNPAGVLSPKMTAVPSDGEDFYTQSFTYTLSLLEALKEQGKELDWDACGVIQIAHNQREEKRWQALKDRKLSKDFIQLLDIENTSKVSGISIPFKSSYFPQGGWVNPSSLVKALVNHPNCEVLVETNAIKINKHGKNWEVRDQDNQIISQSEVLVITTGKDLANFEETNFLPAMPVAGQTSYATESISSKNLKTVVGHEGYFTPSIQGQHIFGATFERNNCNPKLNQESNITNKASLHRYLPELSDSLVDTTSAHTAVRLTTPDRYPYVGGVPAREFYQRHYNDLHQGKQWKDYPPAEYIKGLFVMGGLGSRGLITSGYCATFLVNLITSANETTEAARLLKNCHPARFIIKNLKQNREV